MKALEAGVHVLVEKPIASSAARGEDLSRKAKEKGLVLQVGHIERFNGAFEAILPLIEEPRFIESHRLGVFTPRGIDVSVVLDLMVHDIDIILKLLGNKKLVDCRSSGAGVLTSSPDIVNARLQFEGGCVANITASRISREPLRKIRIFQENLYISADLRQKKVEAFRKRERADIADAAEDPFSFIKPLSLKVDKSEPLKKEIDAFIESVSGGSSPAVTAEEGVKALVIAERILKGLDVS
jgi:predicted dehydrogenase